MIRYRNKKGAASLAEYSITILLVATALAAITTYVKRALQARIRDARHYMISTANSACEDNCRNAAHIAEGKSIHQQYEPYYTQTSATIAQDSVNDKGLVASDVGTTGDFIGKVNAQTQSAVASLQLPPQQAANAEIQ
jgi:hypothetical protein